MSREPVLATRTVSEPKRNLTLRVFGGMHHIKSNHAPYFTLTMELHRPGASDVESCGCDHDTILKYYPQYADLASLHLSDIDGVPMHAESNGWYDLAGALPDQAGEKYTAANSQRHFPKAVIDPAKPWADTDYRPPTPEECLQIFADHVRVDLDTAKALATDIIGTWYATRAACEPATADEAGIYGGNPSETDFPLCWSKRSWIAARQVFSQWIEAQKPRWKAEADACIAKHNLRVFGDPWPVEQTAA